MMNGWNGLIQKPDIKEGVDAGDEYPNFVESDDFYEHNGQDNSVQERDLKADDAVEIIVEEDDPEDEELPENAEKVASKKPKRDQNSRIKEKLRQIEAQNEQLHQENFKLKTSNIEKIDESFHMNHKNLKADYEKLLAEKKYHDEKSESWNQQFKYARVNDDLDLEADASKNRDRELRKSEEIENQLRKLKNKSEKLIEEYDSFKEAVPKVLSQRPNQNVQDNREFPDEYRENYQNFIKKNPYLDSFNEENMNYSPELVAEVSKISSEITKNYKLNGAGDMVGSKQYFNDVQSEINRMIKKENPRQSRRNNDYGRASVAPVSSNTQTKRVRLNESENRLLNNIQKEISQFFPEQKEDLNKGFQNSYLKSLKNKQY